MAYMKDASGRRLDSFEVADKTELATTYATFDRQRAAALAARFKLMDNPIPDVTTDLPTVTHDAVAGTFVGLPISPLSPSVHKIGGPGTWSTSFGRLSVSGIPGLSFYLNDTGVDIKWFFGSGRQEIWIFVDGKPVTATPDASTAFASSTTYHTKLEWATSKRRLIEFFVTGNHGWYEIRPKAITGVITPPPSKPKLGFVFDSFGAGGDFGRPMLMAPFLISRILGVEATIKAIGGTGYSSGSEFFGATNRVSGIASAGVDLVVISGSTNDKGKTDVQTNATAAYSAYASALPDAPLIVFGPQPTNDIDTVSSATTFTNVQVKAAAETAGNVIAFHDMIGSSTGDHVAWVSGTTYQPGQKVSYKGSIYQRTTLDVAGAGTPDQGARWVPLTWLYSGTGNTGTTIGDGTRDIMLYNDDVHPTEAGSALSAIRQGSAILDTLVSYATDM